MAGGSYQSPMRRGDVVFVRGTGFISRAIEDITKSAYSHVALCVAPGVLMEAQGLHPVEYVHALKYSECADVYRTALDSEEIEKVMVRAQTHLGQTYDYFLIGLEFVREETGVQLPYNEAEHHDLICSMLVADAFRPEYDPCPGIEYPTPGDEAKSSLWSYVFSY